MTSIEALTKRLPNDYGQYADKYFLRSSIILEKKALNPWVSAQVFIRRGPGTIHGINEAVAILEHYGNVSDHGGKIWALPEGSTYSSGEVIMRIVAPIQAIVELETMYLGVISARTTQQNDWVDLSTKESLLKIEKNMENVVRAVGDRPVFYFGARHWHWEDDHSIATATLLGGAWGVSTDAGAGGLRAEGVGTIPHALENIYSWAIDNDVSREYPYKESAVVASTLAFDECIDEHVPRIALVDYRNKEITDTLLTATAFSNLHKKLDGIRIDTCGENTMEGLHLASDTLRSMGVSLDWLAKPYWTTSGVSIIGTLMVRQALKEASFEDVKITLSSGFGNIDKVKAFLDAERVLDIKLFDSLGVGQLYPSRTTTMDITHIGPSPDELRGYSKTGRNYKYSSRLLRTDFYWEERNEL